MTTTTKISYLTSASLEITGLPSLASSATIGWQSEKVDNTTDCALDYIVEVTLPMASTAPASEKNVYLYVCPFYYDGTTWYPTDGGTTTLPSGTPGTYTIASPNNLIMLKSFSYTTTQQTIQGVVNLSQAVGHVMPHGFSFIVINYSGAACAASGLKILVTPVKYASV